MKNTKKIMIIGAGVLQVPAIQKAKEMGLYVAALDMDPAALGFRFADECVTVSTNDIEGALEAARQIKPDGVMTLASDMPVRTVAAIGHELGLTANSIKTALNATDKGKMRDALSRNNTPIPKYHIIHSFNEFMDACESFQGYFIVKPADSSGSRGVVLVSRDMDLQDIYQYSRSFSGSGSVLIEEYMEGTEVSVETITVDGKTEIVAITDKLTTGMPYFVEMGHSIPSTLSTASCDAIAVAARSAVNAVGIKLGPAHTEIILTKNGPKIVEIGARLGGDNITTHLVPLATGIDMVECCIKIALGEKIKLPVKKSGGAAIRYFPSKPGRLHSICLPDRELNPNIQEIVFTKNIGDIVNPIKSSNDRIGYVIAKGETPSQAILNCENAIRSTNISIL